MNKQEVKYPKVTVVLVGQDGNAFMILGTVKNALKKAGVEKSEIDLFFAEATAGDYDNLLQVCMKWVNVR